MRHSGKGLWLGGWSHTAFKCVGPGVGLLWNADLEGMWKKAAFGCLRYCPGLEGLSKTRRHSLCVCQGLNPAPPLRDREVMPVCTVWLRWGQHVARRGRTKTSERKAPRRIRGSRWAGDKIRWKGLKWLESQGTRTRHCVFGCHSRPGTA